MSHKNQKAKKQTDKKFQGNHKKLKLSRKNRKNRKNEKKKKRTNQNKLKKKQNSEKRLT